jgi:hypothetical protein
MSKEKKSRKNLYKSTVEKINYGSKKNATLGFFEDKQISKKLKLSDDINLSYEDEDMCFYRPSKYVLNRFNKSNKKKNTNSSTMNLRQNKSCVKIYFGSKTNKNKKH